MKGNKMKLTEDEKRKLALVNRIKLRVDYQEAVLRLRKVNNEKLQGAIKNKFLKDSDGKITPQSICWLFCWATTAISSEKTAQECERIFNEFFDKTYGWFNRKIGYVSAQNIRDYKEKKISF